MMPYLKYFSLKQIIISTIILILFISHNNSNFSFAKAHIKNNFVNKNIIPICCAWGPEIQDGVLLYSIQGGDKKLKEAVTNAIDQWNKNLDGIHLVKSADNENIIISFTNDGKGNAGKTTNTIDNNGFIRNSHIILSKKSFSIPFSSALTEQTAEHELGHAFGLNHANFNGNLMSSRTDTSTPTISSCDIEAVKTANAWKLKEDSISMHSPIKRYVVC
jgi:hypothetical protein